MPRALDPHLRRSAAPQGCRMSMRYRRFATARGIDKNAPARMSGRSFCLGIVRLGEEPQRNEISL
jgi:hypothetical protein